jgi:hypothetical protein
MCIGNDITELKEIKEKKESLERETARIAATLVENLRRVSQMATSSP